TLLPRRSQSVDSYYLEARLPLVSSTAALPLLQSLDLQLALRHDAYETRSTADAPKAASIDGPFAAATYRTNEVASTDNTIGFRYVPWKSFALRASRGTGFLPPTLNQIMSQSATQNFSLDAPDPLRGGTDSYVGVPFTRVTNGNSNLESE